VPKVLSLRLAHASDVLAFELANRTYFAAFVSDRGDAFCRVQRAVRRALAEREARGDADYVLVDDDDGSVPGRFNLYDIRDGTADLGYRVAERVAGRGVATAGVRELCRLAGSEHGVRRLRAHLGLSR
jgi:ribosomal-protein-alanine N-acetyltransferase